MKTDAPYYQPGAKVVGRIYIRALAPCSASHLEIKVKGKEHSRFWRQRFETRRREDGTEFQEEIWEKNKFEHKILEFNGTCQTFNALLMPGDYCVPFEFTLPANIPSSIMWRDDTIREKPKCEITYTVRAKLVTHTNQEMKYK